MRAFAAIPLPGTFAAWMESYRKTLGDRVTRIRLVPAGSCHMTLRFLGDVPRSQLEEMIDRLSSSLAGTAPVQIVLDQTGVFLREGQPSVLWLGPSEVSPDLTVLAAKVDRALSGFGSNSRTERFTPHVTLGRFVPARSSSSGVAFSEQARVPSFPVSAQSVVIFESVLGQGHPSYVPRGAVALGDLPNEASELY